MIFQTKVNGIPCQCHVIHYSPYVPTHVYGPGMGDCNPPEDEEFDYEMLDRRGRRATWLDKYVTQQVHYRIAEEAEIMRKANYYGH